MIGFVKRITEFFHKPAITPPHESLLHSVLVCIEHSRSNSENCILIVTPASVNIVNAEDYPAPIALIAHEKIGEFQETLLHIEERLIKDGHYCIVKLAEDKSYATIFVYVDESILN
jgi:hypothetical protein